MGWLAAWVGLAMAGVVVICSSVNLDLFMASPCVPSGLPESNLTSSFEKSGIRGRLQYAALADGDPEA